MESRSLLDTLEGQSIIGLRDVFTGDGRWTFNDISAKSIQLSQNAELLNSTNRTVATGKRILSVWRGSNGIVTPAGYPKGSGIMASPLKATHCTHWPKGSQDQILVPKEEQLYRWTTLLCLRRH
jgi:hypothetical protein